MPGDIKKYEDLTQYKYGDHLTPSYMRAEKGAQSQWIALSNDLLKAPQIANLNYRAVFMLLVLYTRQSDREQQNCLYNALTEYNEIYSLGMTKEDIRKEAYHATDRNTKYCAGLFTATDKQLLQYGFCDSSAISKCLKELEQNGFITTIWNGKGKYSAWDKNVKIYAFSSKWHRIIKPQKKRNYTKKPGPRSSKPKE